MIESKPRARQALTRRLSMHVALEMKLWPEVTCCGGVFMCGWLTARSPFSLATVSPLRAGKLAVHYMSMSMYIALHHIGPQGQRQATQRTAQLPSIIPLHTTREKYTQAYHVRWLIAGYHNSPLHTEICRTHNKQNWQHGGAHVHHTIQNIL